MAEGRPALEKKRLDALGGESRELGAELSGAELELGAVRQRPAAEGESPGLPHHRNVTRIEAWRVCAHRPHADRHGVRRGAQLVHETPGFLPADPTRAGHGDSPVERDRDLVGDERASERLPGAPGLVLASRLEPIVQLDLDARPTEPVEPTCGLGVRIQASRDDAHDPGCDDRIDAGWRLAVMCARFHRHVERRPVGAVTGGGKRHDLTVPAAVGLGGPLPHDRAVGHDDGTDRRVRVRDGTGRRSELERAIEAHRAAAAMRR